MKNESEYSKENSNNNKVSCLFGLFLTIKIILMIGFFSFWVFKGSWLEKGVP